MNSAPLSVTWLFDMLTASRLWTNFKPPIIRLIDSVLLSCGFLPLIWIMRSFFSDGRHDKSASEFSKEGSSEGEVNTPFNDRYRRFGFLPRNSKNLGETGLLSQHNSKSGKRSFPSESKVNIFSMEGRLSSETRVFAT